MKLKCTCLKDFYSVELWLNLSVPLSNILNIKNNDKIKILYFEFYTRRKES